MASLGEFEAALRALLSPDDALRAQAEARLAQMKALPVELVTMLAQVLRASADETVRSMGAVYLRKFLAVAPEQSLWPHLPPHVRDTVKTELVAALKAEQSVTVRHQMCDTISELAALIITDEHNEWPDLFGTMFEMSTNENVTYRESALIVFSALAAYLGRMLRPQFRALHKLFEDSMKDSQSLRVRVAALAATVNYLTSLEAEERAPFLSLLPLALETIRAALTNNEQTSARSALQLLIHMAESEPSFLRNYAQTLVSSMTTLANMVELDENIRQLALEFLVTLAENAPSMCRRMGAEYMTAVLPACMKFASEIDMDADWGERQDKEESDSLPVVGEQALDRLAVALGGRAVLPTAFNVIMSMLSNDDWHARSAALTTISAIGEGCTKEMQHQLASILPLVTAKFDDPHPRVRYAAVSCLGQMCTDFAPNIQKQHHFAIMSALVKLINDPSVPRVQATACAAVINFTEKCEKEVIMPYAEHILGKLYELLRGGRRIVQEQAITAIASVADLLGEEFAKYYDVFVPLLKQILSAGNTKDFRVMRGKALECMSLVGMAVGKEKFRPDAKQTMDFLASQSATVEADDPQIGYMMQAWARIASCLGQEFVPYLTFVMPPLIAAAEMRPDVAIADADDEETARTEGWETVQIGDRMVAIKNSVLEEKKTALQLLSCYLGDLGASMFPFIKDVAKTVVSLIVFYIDDDVRSAAVSCLADMVKCARSAADTGVAPAEIVKQLLDFILSKLFEATTSEPEISIQMAMLEEFHGCIKNAGQNCLTAEQLQASGQLLLSVFKQSEERRADRVKQTKGPDFDEEEAERIDEENLVEEDLLGQMTEAVTQLVKTHHELFVPVFDVLAPHFGALLTPTRASHDHVVGLCVFDDVIEHGGPTAAKYVAPMVPYFLGYAQDKVPGVRQAAVFGIGLIAELFPNALADRAAATFEQVVAIVNDVDSRTDENIYATENSFTTIAKLAAAFPSLIDQNKAWTLFMSSQPISHDEEETSVSARILCTQIEAQNQVVLGGGFRNLPQILRALVFYLSAKRGEEPDQFLCDPVLRQRMTTIVQNVRAALTPELSAALSHQMTTEEREALARLTGVQF